MVSLFLWLSLVPGLQEEPPGLKLKEEQAAYDRAVGMVREALSRRPGDPRLLQVLGEVCQKQRRFQEAIEAFQSAARLDPGYADPVLGLAQAYAHSGENERAVEAYRRLLSMGERELRGPARLGLAAVLFETGRHAEAAGELRAALGEGESGAEVFYLLGRALDAQLKALPESGSKKAETIRLEEEEAAALREAIRLDPSHAAAHYMLGMLLRRQGRADLAKAELETFRRLKPSRSQSFRQSFLEAEEHIEAQTALKLARATLDAGDGASALKQVRHVLIEKPDFVDALVLQGWICLRLDRLDESLRSYEEALRRDPRNAAALWNLGKIHLRSGRLQEAAPLLLEAAEIRKSFLEGWELLAQLAQEGSIYADRAEEFAGKALRLRASAANYIRLAAALHTSGKRAECEKVLREGLARFPADPDLQAGLQAFRHETKR